MTCKGYQIPRENCFLMNFKVYLTQRVKWDFFMAFKVYQTPRVNCFLMKFKGYLTQWVK